MCDVQPLYRSSSSHRRGTLSELQQQQRDTECANDGGGGQMII
jgi:hypothetical protein